MRRGRFLENVTERFVQTTNFRDQFTDIADACALAHSIVDTVREPVLVLDKKLRVIAASRSFYSSFKVRPEDTQGKLLYTLGDGQWDIPKLRVLLEQIIPEHGVMEDYEVEHEFPGVGHRTMYLNARQVSTKQVPKAPSCLAWRMLLSGGSWSAKRMSYCDKRK
jgi:chemotaxis protein methyltransferase CheR